eukprot:CAMPEP_0202685406 /NCGR_PEP_ID=MMETSP1385-20130828/1150_1 /ASSEMBLY_ACC=CAM_ASM_000861 /TAXON_ID=933848 /ORGANISM="Elphidium margaritaceum" /LENGTH=654 /DNA_ID=CAMNT_0049339743 /DNA_START=63 /DNA_END=2027 /DNA_ORIENTATION=+
MISFSLPLPLSLLLSAFTKSTHSASSSNKQCNGPDYGEISIFDGVSTDFCVHAFYNNTNVKSLNITFTGGDVVFGSEIISEDDDPAEQEKEICDPSFSPHWEQYHSCSLCVGFDSIQMSDEWAKICPKYIVRCEDPLALSTVEKSVSAECFTVGDADKDDIAKIVGGNTDFTFKLLSSNALTNDIVTDLFVSPLSISNALFSAMMAASGETLSQMMAAFELTSDDYAMFDSYDALIVSLRHNSDRLQCAVQNDLWVNAMWYKVLSPQYLKDFDRFGDISACDFKNNSFAETLRIDDNAEKVTHRLIEHPLDRQNLSSNTVMLYTNAMYLRAAWVVPFTQNVSQTFTDAEREEIEIKMMSAEFAVESSIRMYNDSFVEVIELPFDDDFSELAFIVIRPAQKKYIEEGPSSTIEFEEKLSRALLSEWLNGLQPITTALTLRLPFLEMYNMQDITASLQAIGIVDMFDPKQADLRNLTVPRYQVYETSLQRQDYLKITNDGVETASFVTDGGSVREDTTQGAVEHADVPFLFLIMDRSVDMILYAGRVTNPRGWVMDGGNNIPDANKDAHHHKLAHILLVMLLGGVLAYFLIKYIFNRVVLQLNGVEAIPHIDQCRFCAKVCSDKVDQIRNAQQSDDAIVPNPIDRYRELVQEDDRL